MTEAGRELDAEVAEKVMGWRWEPWPHNLEQPHLIPPDYDHGHSDIWWLGRFVYELVPHYSTDIAAAWLVVEHLQLAVIPDASGGWCVSHAPFVGSGWYEKNVNDWEHAETAPLAICLAALAEVAP